MCEFEFAVGTTVGLPKCHLTQHHGFANESLCIPASEPDNGGDSEHPQNYSITFLFANPGL